MELGSQVRVMSDQPRKDWARHPTPRAVPTQELCCGVTDEPMVAAM